MEGFIFFSFLAVGTISCPTGKLIRDEVKSLSGFNLKLLTLLPCEVNTDQRRQIKLSNGFPRAISTMAKLKAHLEGFIAN